MQNSIDVTHRSVIVGYGHRPKGHLVIVQADVAAETLFFMTTSSALEFKQLPIS